MCVPVQLAEKWPNWRKEFTEIREIPVKNNVIFSRVSKSLKFSLNMKIEISELSPLLENRIREFGAILNTANFHKNV